MVCRDCGDAIGMNTICKTPLQSATDMLKHMAVHSVSRAFVPVVQVAQPEPETDASLYDWVGGFSASPSLLGPDGKLIETAS
jgi:hypothetical protein